MAARSPIEETFRGGGGGSGVQLIDPTGGGGAQIARPGESAAPNFAGMFSEATRAALEPAKFMWGMYKDREELSKQQQQLMLRGQELDETKRSNLIRESQTEALQEIDRQKEAEIVRHNKADEIRLAAQEEREKTADEWKKSYYGALQSEATARADEAKQNLDSAKEYADRRKSDLAAVDALRAKIKSYGPSDLYSAQDHPELLGIVDDALRQVTTKEGKDALADLIGDRTALGQEITREREVLGWSPESKDRFISIYNGWGGRPETIQGRQISGPELFDQAYRAGKEVEDRRKTMDGWTFEGTKGYNDAMANPEVAKLPPAERERIAFAVGKQREEEFQQGIKKPTHNIAPMSEDKILQLVEDEMPKDTDPAVMSQVKADAVKAENERQGGATEVVNQYKQKLAKPAPIGTTSGTAQTDAQKAIDAHANKLLGPQTPTPTATPKPVITQQWGYNPRREEPTPSATPTSKLAPAATPTPTPAAVVTPTPSPVTQNTNIPLSSWDYWKQQFNQPEEPA